MGKLWWLCRSFEREVAVSSRIWSICGLFRRILEQFGKAIWHICDYIMVPSGHLDEFIVNLRWKERNFFDSQVILDQLVAFMLKSGHFLRDFWDFVMDLFSSCSGVLVVMVNLQWIREGSLECCEPRIAPSMEESNMRPLWSTGIIPDITMMPPWFFFLFGNWWPIFFFFFGCKENCLSSSNYPECSRIN